ncbi:hypothetical protein [Neoaquamicrobium sediminum]|nr:hypothetical protein [Mesorhizobium sediminum]
MPNCYRSIMTDMASAVADDEYSAEEGAEELIAELNDCLAE